MVQYTTQSLVTKNKDNFVIDNIEIIFIPTNVLITLLTTRIRVKCNK